MLNFLLVILCWGYKNSAFSFWVAQQIFLHFNTIMNSMWHLNIIPIKLKTYFYHKQPFQLRVSEKTNSDVEFDAQYKDDIWTAVYITERIYISGSDPRSSLSLSTKKRFWSASKITRILHQVKHGASLVHHKNPTVIVLVLIKYIGFGNYVCGRSEWFLTTRCSEYVWGSMCLADLHFFGSALI